MSKRKNDERWDWRVVAMTVISMIALVATIFQIMWSLSGDVVDGSVATVADCFDVGSVDFVMTGYMDNRERRVESPALLMVLESMALERVDVELGEVIHRPIDMSFYSGWSVSGTILVIHSDVYQQWYLQINDGLRGDCGLYAVAADDVLLIMDGLK